MKRLPFFMMLCCVMLTAGCSKGEPEKADYLPETFVGKEIILNGVMPSQCNYPIRFYSDDIGEFAITSYNDYGNKGLPNSFTYGYNKGENNTAWLYFYIINNEYNESYNVTLNFTSPNGGTCNGGTFSLNEFAINEYAPYMMLFDSFTLTDQFNSTDIIVNFDGSNVTISTGKYNEDLRNPGAWWERTSPNIGLIHCYYDEYYNLRLLARVSKDIKLYFTGAGGGFYSYQGYYNDNDTIGWGSFTYTEK